MVLATGSVVGPTLPTRRALVRWVGCAGSSRALHGPFQASPGLLGPPRTLHTSLSWALPGLPGLSRASLGLPGPFLALPGPFRASLGFSRALPGPSRALPGPFRASLGSPGPLWATKSKKQKRPCNCTKLHAITRKLHAPTWGEKVVFVRSIRNYTQLHAVFGPPNYTRITRTMLAVFAPEMPPRHPFCPRNAPKALRITRE
jgi:hypothetical protein